MHILNLPKPTRPQMQQALELVQFLGQYTEQSMLEKPQRLLRFIYYVTEKGQPGKVTKPFVSAID